MSNPSFVYVTYIRTTPEKLWQALTDGAFTQQYWSGNRIESDWVVGARVRFLSGDTESDYGEVLEHEPCRRLSYSWHLKYHEVFSREKPSRVVFELEPIAGDVKLTITHDQFEPGSKTLHAVSNGWPIVLASLKSFLETGSGLALANAETAKNARAQAIARAQSNAG